MRDGIKIYDVDYRSEYTQYYLPKKNPSIEEKIARKQRSLVHLPFNYSAVAFQVMPAQYRTSFLMQNLSTVFDLWVGFGVIPDPVNNIGLRIARELAHEPLYVPQNEIWVISTGIGAGTIVWSVD